MITNRIACAPSRLMAARVPAAAVIARAFGPSTPGVKQRIRQEWPVT
ncbi:hypothetical protein [Aeromicrobium sp. CTD01-1L150]